VTAAGPDLLKRLARTGARVVSHRGRTVRARIPLGAVKDVASWRSVRHVGVAGGWIAQKVVSEGDAAHAAALARTRRHVTGVGTKVCVLSTGIPSLAASQAAGELPDVDVLAGQEGASDDDEGTAMLEIVHDIAPNAALGFATALGGDPVFAANIRALRFQAGCDILVDDIL
jgi:hypothetical protein